MKGLIVLVSAALVLSNAVSAIPFTIFNQDVAKGACEIMYRNEKSVKDLGFDCDPEHAQCYYEGDNYPDACNKLKSFLECDLDCEVPQKLAKLLPQKSQDLPVLDKCTYDFPGLHLHESSPIWPQ
ncbi:hypothetical protein B0O80DRAFT_495607 [Mortierella sp. GBAus27b]|nr:hypothetical protein BGX31_011625 [Mortierella sp. GBA43]KAI8358964.1 hypothetical protein B0O80DRAFT_495607 [Mortierella sp. GBAus27b]